jgi:two-component system OmpR family response regulator
MRLLLVEDNEEVALQLVEGLRETYSVDQVATGSEAHYLSQVNDYDLLILDIGLPDMDGVELCTRIRQNNTAVPILMLTAEDEVALKVRALDAGADDYLTKPFSLAELQARIRALLRRPRQAFATVLSLGDLRLDTATREAERGGNALLLQRKQFDLLEYFLRNPGRVLTRYEIMEHVWDNAADPLSNVIDVHIQYLRKQVDRPFSTKLIHTVKGVGYKLGPAEL